MRVMKGWGALVGGLLLSLTGLGSAAETVPISGARRFLVLVDSSRSMVSRPGSPATTAAKIRALAEAERRLTAMLFAPGAAPGSSRGAARPWFRPGQDRLELAHYGFDRSSNASSAYRRLKGASLGRDYLRPTSAGETADGFRRRLRPPFRTSLNVLAWTLPLGLAASAPRSEETFQETYVLLLADAQLNDGTLALERATMALHLGAAARRRLEKAEEALARDVRIVDANGAPGALAQERFGPESDRIAITVFRVEPVLDADRIARLAATDPLDGAALSLDLRGRLHVGFGAPKALEAVPAVLSIVGRKNATRERPLARSNDLVLAPPSGDRDATLRLVTVHSAGNPLLGRRRFGIVHDRAVLIPDEGSGVRRLALLALAFGGLGAAALAAAAYHRRYVASPATLWLWDYSEGFGLPSLGRGGVGRFVSRTRRSPESSAFALRLPPLVVRRALFRDVRLTWDPALGVASAHAIESGTAITDLPRDLEFVWSDRPTGHAEVALERSGNGEAKLRSVASVTFSGPSSIATPVPSLSPTSSLDLTSARVL